MTKRWNVHKTAQICPDVSWRDKWKIERLYQGQPKLSEKLTVKRMKLAGHLVRHPEEAAHDTGW